MTYPFMEKRLAESSLTPGDINATPELGAFDSTPRGYRIPYYRPDGSLHPFMYRVRLEKPQNGGKYTQPSREEIEKAGGVDSDSTYPYLNPKILGVHKWEDIGKLNGKRVFIVEGEVKAACVGKLIAVPAIGIGGCNNATRADPITGVHKLHPVIASLLQPNDAVTIILDGDITTNEQVNRAAGTLRRVLRGMGITPTFMLLPTNAKIDDYLHAQGANAKAAFDALPLTEGDGFREDLETLWDFLGLQIERKRPVCNARNIERVLIKHEHYAGRLWHDEATGWSYLDDQTIGNVHDEVVWMQDRVCSTWTNAPVEAVFNSVERMPTLKRNTIHEWIEKETWDGTDRLEEIGMKVYNADDNVYTRAVFRNWMIGAVARAYRPGCEMHNMLVLEGAQGMGKSRSLKILGGGGYLSLSGDVNNKDFILAAHGGWLVDIDELNSFKYGDYQRIKGMLSTATDDVRSPYSRRAQARHRRFVFAGTTNNSQYLRDDTGNRRFWPIECHGFPNQYKKPKTDEGWLTTNVGQLWAEAKHRFDAGESWWDMPDGITELMQAAREEVDPWEATIASVFADPTAGHALPAGGRFIATDELLFAVGVAIKDMDVMKRQRVVRCAKRVGPMFDWEKGTFETRTTPITLSTGASVVYAKGWKTKVAGAAGVPNVTSIRSKI